MIDPRDEELHAASSRPAWQESYYFNWADARAHAFGLARIGFRFGDRRADAIVVAMRDGRPEFLYPGVGIRERDPHASQRAADGIRVGRLEFRMEKALERWRLSLRGKDTLELSWTAFTPAYDYSDGGLASDVAQHHFEQAGRVQGFTRFHGREIAIDGTGERDKSWGVRDWATISGWTWVSAQLDDKLAFNFWLAAERGEQKLAGYVYRDGALRPIVEARFRVEPGVLRYSPRRAVIDLCDGDGAELHLSATALARFPLLKKGLWIEEVFAAFELDGRSGLGVIEIASHVAPAARVSRAGDLIRSSARALFT